MREYGKVSPNFWTGKTGKAIRKNGPEATIVALYLISSPQSNMLGLYYQPILYLAHETGLGLEGASKGLQGAIEAGFCKYDSETEMVWIPEMAKYQIACVLKESDNRCTNIQREYSNLPDNPFLGEFFDRYRSCFHLKDRRNSQAPPKALRSQEQEQDHEQEKKIMPPLSEKPASAKASAKTRGTRLPDDWTLTKSLAELGIAARRRANLPDLTREEILFEAESFKDYWRAKAGKDATKVDWSLTWVTWMRRARGLGISHSKVPQQSILAVLGDGEAT